LWFYRQKCWEIAGKMFFFNVNSTDFSYLFFEFFCHFFSQAGKKKEKKSKPAEKPFIFTCWI
jgi:hypothetical protein